jgi:hypothetical protein
MRMFELFDGNLVEQRYLGLYRLLTEQPDDESYAEEHPNTERLKQNLLDVLTAWRHENPKATTIPLDKFIASIHDPVIDIDPERDKQFVIDTLSSLDGVVSKVSPDEDKIYLVGSRPEFASSEGEADKQAEHTKDQAQKALRKTINQPIKI